MIWYDHFIYVSWKLCYDPKMYMMWPFYLTHLSNKIIERQLNEFNALKQQCRTIIEYEARFMELLRYAPHLNTKKLKVNKFIYGLNFPIRANVCIPMPHTFLEVIQRALIVEEECLSGG